MKSHHQHIDSNLIIEGCDNDMYRKNDHKLSISRDQNKDQSLYDQISSVLEIILILI